MKRTEHDKKILLAMSDLKKLYRKHGFETVRIALNRFQTALREKTRAEKKMREAQAEFEKITKKNSKII